MQSSAILAESVFTTLSLMMLFSNGMGIGPISQWISFLLGTLVRGSGDYTIDIEIGRNVGMAGWRCEVKLLCRFNALALERDP